MITKGGRERVVEGEKMESVWVVVAAASKEEKGFISGGLWS